MRNINPKTDIIQKDNTSFILNKKLGSKDFSLQNPESYKIIEQTDPCSEFCSNLSQLTKLSNIKDCLIANLNSGC